MTPTKLAALVGALPPFVHPDLDAARQLLAANPDGRPTLAQLTGPTIQQAIAAITSYQHGCRQLSADLADIAPGPATARLIEFGL
ncbi:MAG: hypothetical protein ACKO4U_00815 [Caldilinea sp.]